MRDRIVGIICILTSLFLLFSLREKAFEAKAFPTALLVIFIILSIMLVIDKKKEKHEFHNLKSVLLNCLLFFAYIFMMPHIGFIISTTCFISLFIIISKYSMKKTTVIIMSLLVSMIIWFIFSYLFGISLPEILF
ncbi:MAG: hypothetical protein APF77_14175 [Clostridia bacterium BRH_c25]|nr:MAG: hypothetical protein APF77_14175 [Clostridia bacterium BRH_c25]